METKREDVFLKQLRDIVGHLLMPQKQNYEEELCVMVRCRGKVVVVAFNVVVVTFNVDMVTFHAVVVTFNVVVVTFNVVVVTFNVVVVTFNVVVVTFHAVVVMLVLMLLPTSQSSSISVRIKRFNFHF